MEAPGRVVAVSLKLYFDTARTVEYCRAVAGRVSALPDGTLDGVRLAVLPSVLAIPRVAGTLTGAGILLGAQDLCQADRGAFTGEVSGTDLAAEGCAVVEVGHAERRTIYGESDELVAQKTAAALRNGLIPLLCVGEAERSDEAAAIATCAEQVRSATGGGTTSEVWVAYEPYWAIGAPAPAPQEYVSAVCSGLRDEIAADVPKLSILYGGSAGPGLLSTLDGVDGLFLGRFAHDPEAFVSVALEAAGLG